MTRLQDALRRLYGDEAGGQPTAGTQGQVRAFVLELAGPAAWSALAPVWQGVQADLELPAPGIAVSGSDAYQLWFSLAQPAPVAQVQAVLQALCARYLAQVPSNRIELHPGTADAPLLPPLERAPDCWSAFIAPDLASMFADERWLDVPPNPEAQADLLARLQPATPAEWARAQQLLAPSASALVPVAPATTTTAVAVEETGPSPAAGAVDMQDPRRFLLAVMNDPAVALPLRIDAAKALLPFMPGDPRG